MLGRGHTVNILPLETGLTDLLLIELASRHSGRVVVKRTPGHVESLEGMDFEMRITDLEYAVDLRVQAKKMDPRSGIYPELHLKRPKAKGQCKALLAHAGRSGAYPLYLFYNALAVSPMSRDPKVDWRYGCAIASASTVERVLKGSGAVTFDAIQQAPWHYLVCPDTAVSVPSVVRRLDTLLALRGDEEFGADVPGLRMLPTSAGNDAEWLNASFADDLGYRVLVNLNYQ